MADHPYPDLSIQAGSGLSFPWAEYLGAGVQGTSSMSMGPDGVAASMSMIIRFSDLLDAAKELIGYSYRSVNQGTGAVTLRRNLPWKHPFLTQLWVKSITNVTCLAQEGKTANLFSVDPGAGGIGWLFKLSPYTNYAFCVLTIQFWRPPYYIRSDEDIVVDGTPREWLRYTERIWQSQTQALTREGNQFLFRADQGLQNNAFKGVSAAIINKLKVKYIWHDVPERCLFVPIGTSDPTPMGIPYPSILTQTAVTNPITNYPYTAGRPIVATVNAPIGGTTLSVTGTITAGSPTVTAVSADVRNQLTVGDELIGVGIPAGTTYVAGPTATTLTMSQNGIQNAVATTIHFDIQAKRIFGALLGTSLLESVEFIPKPLQLPALLMQIPSFNQGEPISQRQYDVVYNFELFDGPRSQRGRFRGHNNMPWSVDGMWYTVDSERVIGINEAYKATPFHFADHSDLFKSV